MSLVRIQFDLTDRKVEQLDQLMNEAGITTRKDLFNNALSVLEWVIKYHKQGRAIVAVSDREGEPDKELWMPMFDNHR